jgi:hypothetical protein
MEALKAECHFIQNKFEHKLVHLQGVEFEIPVHEQNHFNKADYADLGGDLTKIPRLVFKEIDGPGDIVIAENEMKQSKGYFIFDEIVYVEGTEQRVFGYGILP